MSDLQDMTDFLGQLPPFDGLPPAAREGLAKRLESLYVCQANQDEMIHEAGPALYLVRSAMMDRLDHRGQAVERLEAGDLLGSEAMQKGKAPRVEVIRDGIVHRLRQPDFHDLCDRHAVVRRYFQAADAGRLLSGPGRASTQTDWAERPLVEIIDGRLITVGEEETIRQAAEKMQSEGVSSLPVLRAGELLGVLTDRDLRNRVLAAGRDTADAVAAVMTPDPVTIQSRQSVFDALYLMSRHNIHHLPVVDEQGVLLGMVTTSDLIRQQQSEPVLLINRLNKASGRAQLIREAASVPGHIRAFAGRTEDAYKTSQLLATLSDTMTRRLIEEWIELQGSAPADFAWLAFGSQAREDQNLHSDQDNGLLIADQAPDKAQVWFAGLADHVCGGLADCGIRLCPGEVMARNPEWRLSLSDWRKRFRDWTNEPTPKGVMQSMIFFDSRCIHGDPGLYERHRRGVAELGKNRIFLAHMARRVSQLPIPLGLFQRLRTTSHEGVEGLDIKRHGIAVINDIIRIHSLAHGLLEPHTPARLRQLQRIGVINPSDSQDLLEAWHLLINLRLEAQVLGRTAPGNANAVVPARLSTLERRQLKVAFRVIKSAQQALQFEFLSGY